MSKLSKKARDFISVVTKSPSKSLQGGSEIALCEALISSYESVEALGLTVESSRSTGAAVGPALETGEAFDLDTIYCRKIGALRVQERDDESFEDHIYPRLERSLNSA